MDGQNVTLHVTFGHHCFTDEKGNAPLIYPKEGRYWSQERYDCTHTLPNLIRTRFPVSYAIPYTKGKNKEQYHYMESNNYAIFFDINRPENTTNELKLKIVSAYELAQWGRETVPKGKPKKISWILSQRVKGLSAL
ncbi:hypothetical protein [Vibrio parahaemolyticus]|uniref:hypothetical protein n=1 Tax=Vibrio parahaemolyticus TaxID=670 RepID=UPI002B1EBB9B|nr:hypothetical protein [Vibrio parahaemolyticus]